MTTHSLLLASLLAASLTVTATAGDTHPFSIHDMLAMDRVGDPQLSPDGGWVVFTRRTTDLEANRGRTDLWVVGTDGKGLRRLTTHPAGDSNPRWSADGKTVWFLSSRSDSSQIWRIPIDGGEAQPFTDLPLDVTGFNLSPQGDRIALAMDVFVDCETVQCSRDRLDEIEERKWSARVYEQAFVRHWDTWKDGRRSHVFVLPAEGDGERSVAGLVDVMQGLDADCPSKPFGGSEDFTFTPDGQGIVLVARDAGREEPWSTDFDLYLAAADGSAAPRNLTAANPAWDTGPTFSPDGKTLAYLAMREPGYESDRLRIVLRAWPGDEERVLTEGWDRSPSGLAWSEDGKTIYANADHLGQRSLFAIDVKKGKVRTVVEEGTVRSIAPTGDRIVFSMDHLRSPVELYSVKTDGTDRKRITRINDATVAAARMGEPEQFSFKGWNDEEVYVYVVKPVDFDDSRKYPVAFLIHGGPQGSFGNDFHYRWNPQAYAGAGYAAVMVDFHGSTGYGQAFTDSIQGDWGGKPLEDLKKGLAATLERYPWMDGERVGALGASFGGYMVNWIAGNWPDRFRCLINHDGNLDERMAYYATEELWFPERDHMGTPWENPEGYEKHNPVRYVQNWKTPMLVIHGARDYRVVDTQGLATFNALQRRGVPSKLVYFPDENHWVLQPHNSVFWHETVIGWLDRWVKGE